MRPRLDKRQRKNMYRLYTSCVDCGNVRPNLLSVGSGGGLANLDGHCIVGNVAHGPGEVIGIGAFSLCLFGIKLLVDNGGSGM